MTEYSCTDHTHRPVGTRERGEGGREEGGREEGGSGEGSKRIRGREGKKREKEEEGEGEGEKEGEGGGKEGEGGEKGERERGEWQTWILLVYPIITLSYCSHSHIQWHYCELVGHMIF